MTAPETPARAGACLPPPASATFVVDQGSEAYSWQPRPGIVCHHARGIVTLALARHFAAAVQDAIASGTHVRIFGDLEQVTHYEREARELMTELVKQQGASIESLHFLLASKFVALGLGVYMHVVGYSRLRVYSDRGSFLRSYAAAVEHSPEARGG